MQEKIQNISPIKQRILQFIVTLHISKREFYKKTGISRGTLESNSGITEDILAKVIANFEDLSPDWILTGNGPMLRNHGIINSGNGQQVVANHNNGTINADNRKYYSDSPDVLRAQIDTLNERIKEKDAQIKEKDAQIKEKDAQIKEKDAQINKLIELLGKKYESGQ